MAVKSVTFSGSGRNTSITVNGIGFGSAPVALPYVGGLLNFWFLDHNGSVSCSNDALFEAGFAGNSVTLNYSSWNDRQIRINGFSGSYGGNNWYLSPGDLVTIHIWNFLSGQAASWTGPVPGAAAAPRISSVQFSGSGKTLANLHVTIKGSGFGSSPQGMPGEGTSPYFELTDAALHSASRDGLFDAGHCGDAITIRYSAWADTRIELQGFGGWYGIRGNHLYRGDPVTLIAYSTASSRPPGWSGVLQLLRRQNRRR